MICLYLRHMLLVFRDKTNLLLSFASAFVILGLYALFIRDFMLDAVRACGIADSYSRSFVDSLMLSGLIIVVGATANLGTVGIYIRDKETGKNRDFLTAPVRRGAVFGSYLAAGVTMSLLVMGLVFVLSVAILNQVYDVHYERNKLLLAVGVLILSAILSNLVLFAIALFLKTGASFSSFGNLYGVAIGFLTGVYIPIGYYPEGIQTAAAFFPMGQTTALLRQLLTEPALSQAPQAADSVEEMFGVRVCVPIFGESAGGQLLLLLVLTALLVFYFLLALAHRYKGR